MTTAKLFRHGGSQAVRLPKPFRFEGTAVAIERRGDEVVLKPLARRGVRTLPDVARYLAATHPRAAGFPGVTRLRTQQKRDLDW